MNTAPLYSVEHNSSFDAPNATGSPERRLLLAILERAILDFVGNDLREVQGAAEWIFADDSDENDEFTFSWLCTELDLDQSQIAEYIRAMPKRGNHRIAPWYLTKSYSNKDEQQLNHNRVISIENEQDSKQSENQYRRAS